MTQTCDQVGSTGRLRHSRSPLWLSAIVLGGVFYYLHHDPQISTVEFWSPWAETTDAFASSNTALRGTVFLSVALLGGAFAFQYGGRLRFGNVLSIVVACFVGWSLLSLLWSDDVRLTLIRIGLLLITCLGGFGLSRALTPRRWIELTLLLTGVYAVIGICAELAVGTFRPWQAEYRFAGTLHPNAQGGNLGLFCLAAYSLLRWRPRHGAQWAALLALGVCLLILTKSRTAVVAALLALALMEAIAWRSWKPVFVGLTLASVVGAVALQFVALGVDLQKEATQLVHLGRTDEVEDLNGRSQVWEALTPYVHARLWTGYGYDSFWTQSHIEQVQWMARWPVRDAHSAYLNLMLGIGLPGAVLFVAMLATAGWCSVVEFRRRVDPAFALVFGLVIHSLVSGILESNEAPPSMEVLLLSVGCCFLAFPPGVSVRSLDPDAAPVRCSLSHSPFQVPSRAS